MLLATELIHAQVASNRVEPGRESGFVLELAGSLHEAQERVLSDVLGPRGMPQVAQGEVVDGSLVTTQELGERFAIASLIADHENLVARLTVRRGHGRGPSTNPPASRADGARHRPKAGSRLSRRCLS